MFQIFYILTWLSAGDHVSLKESIRIISLLHSISTYKTRFSLYSIFLYLSIRKNHFIFPLGQIILHLIQDMHSPSVNELSCSLILTGQLFLHALHLGIQLSLLRLRDKNGSTGNIANTAPSGHRNWQKNLSLIAIPTITIHISIVDVAYTANLYWPTLI